MSLESYVWVADLPLDVCSPTAFRVLLKLADRSDRFGYTAWRSASKLSHELRCSVRTIRRAVAELVELELIVVGDQRYVDHIPANRRPVVYDLQTPAKRFRDENGIGREEEPRGRA